MCICVCLCVVYAVFRCTDCTFVSAHTEAIAGYDFITLYFVASSQGLFLTERLLVWVGLAGWWAGESLEMTLSPSARVTVMLASMWFSYSCLQGNCHWVLKHPHLLRFRMLGIGNINRYSLTKSFLWVLHNFKICINKSKKIFKNA